MLSKSTPNTSAPDKLTLNKLTSNKSTSTKSALDKLKLNQESYQRYRMAKIKKKLEYNNELERIYNAFPNENWDSEYFIANPNLHILFYKKIMEKKLSKYKDNYIENDNFPLNQENIKLLTNVDISKLSSSMYLTVDMIKNNFLLTKLNIDLLSWYCRWEVYLEFKNEIRHWNYTKLSQNRHVFMDIIENNKTIPLDYSVLHKNPNLTLNFFEKNITQKWAFKELSKNKIITLKIIQKYPDINWDYTNFSKNINVYWETVCQNPDIKWSYDNLSTNPNITWKIITENCHLPWSINNFHYNSSLTLDDIEKSFLIQWDFNKIAHNWLTFNSNYYWISIRKYVKSGQFIIPELKQLICDYI